MNKRAGKFTRRPFLSYLLVAWPIKRISSSKFIWRFKVQTISIKHCSAAFLPSSFFSFSSFSAQTCTFLQHISLSFFLSFSLLLLLLWWYDLYRFPSSSHLNHTPPRAEAKKKKPNNRKWLSCQSNAAAAADSSSSVVQSRTQHCIKLLRSFIATERTAIDN